MSFIVFRPWFELTRHVVNHNSVLVSRLIDDSYLNVYISLNQYKDHKDWFASFSFDSIIPYSCHIIYIWKQLINDQSHCLINKCEWPMKPSINLYGSIVWFTWFSRIRRIQIFKHAPAALLKDPPALLLRCKSCNIFTAELCIILKFLTNYKMFIVYCIAEL